VPKGRKNDDDHEKLVPMFILRDNKSSASDTQNPHRFLLESISDSSSPLFRVLLLDILLFSIFSSLLFSSLLFSSLLDLLDLLFVADDVK